MYPFHFEVTQNYQELSAYAADLIIDVIKKNPTGLYCFAGGDTPVKTLNLLVEAHQNGEIDLTKLHFIELDEWVGLDQANPGSCIAYLQRELFDPAGISLENVHYFDAKAEDLLAECEKANQVIQAHGNLTLTLLGVGENGHLGFNEPGVNKEELAHVVVLDESTQTVGQKYFSGEVEHSKGITLGLNQLLKSETLIVEASGSKKQGPISALLKGPITDKWPVTFVREHSNCFVVVDQAAL